VSLRITRRTGPGTFLAAKRTIPRILSYARRMTPDPVEPVTRLTGDRAGLAGRRLPGSSEWFSPPA
ncbi:hypothetical protein WAJ21_19980, partial [Acinetobacter baumannii]